MSRKYDGSAPYEMIGATLAAGDNIPVVLTEDGGSTIESTTIVHPAGLVMDGAFVRVQPSRGG